MRNPNRSRRVPGEFTEFWGSGVPGNSGQIFHDTRVKWWPGTESNRRRQPFQGIPINLLQTTLHENTRLTRTRFGLHLDASRESFRVWTPPGLHNQLPHSVWKTNCFRARGCKRLSLSSRDCGDKVPFLIRDGYHEYHEPVECSIPGDALRAPDRRATGS